MRSPLHLLAVGLVSVSCAGDGGGEGRGPDYGLSESERPAGVGATLRVRDAHTGTVYDAVGRVVEGTGDRLVPLVGFNQFWFAWSVFNHGSEIFGTDDLVQTAPLESDTECAVPCDEIRLGCPGKDCIPALTRPEHVRADSPEASYLSDESFVVGVEFGAEVRAYPHNILWWHEIANDVVGGVPVAVTHCPLTFSSIGHDPTAFLHGQTVELGVSGRLYNNNLTFYNRADDTWFVQLLGVGTRGAKLGEAAPRVHVWEMTWAAWRELFPSTTVLSENTGHARNYQQYPYGDYFIDQSDFRPTNPPDDGRFPKKAITYGVRLGDAAKAYVYSELAAWAARTYGEDAAPAGVVNDRIGGRPVAIVFDVDASYAQAFDRSAAGDLELVR